MPSGFDAVEIRQVCEAMCLAEDCVSDHFRLSEGFWLRHPFQLRTLAQLEPAEISSHALAQVLRLREPCPRAGIRPRDFYRICLQDHNLKNAVKTMEPAAFSSLLVYVLVHELIHVVRFSRFQGLFQSPHNLRMQEESLVHGLTHKILSCLPLPNLDAVLNCYGEGRA